MDLIVASHPSSLQHDTGPNHPERPDRVDAVRKGLEAAGTPIRWLTSPPVDRDLLLRTHSSEYVEMIEALCTAGGGALDMDTLVGPQSLEAALTAAGGLVALIEEMEAGASVAGFALARPPGHHALRARAMGFCIFNNVVIAANWLCDRGSRVAIIDWDVHHGNGTQALVGDNADILYISLHQEHFYPFEGSIDDIDRSPAGTTVNIPLRAGTAGDLYRQAWTQAVIPTVDQYGPDWILVSAGYDAHVSDPLADLMLIDDDYGWLSQELAGIHPVSRTAIVLEGGYDLAALEGSAKATVRGLTEDGAQFGEPLESPWSWDGIAERTLPALSKFWSL